MVLNKLFLYILLVQGNFAQDATLKQRSPGSEEVRPNISSSCFNTTNYTPPRCIDHPDGYGCDCGPGFRWNTAVCISKAVDSRLEFSEQTPLRYTLLTGKAFPRLYEFTIAFWIKIPNPSINGTILSYKHEDHLNVLVMRSGPNLTFDIWHQKIQTGLSLAANVWNHIVWTWASEDGSWVLYINGIHKMAATGTPSKAIPQGGEFVLGQASRGDFEFNENNAFVGDLTHLHIWSEVLTSLEVFFVKNTCGLMYCGDAVQWTDFRRGTRGAMKMRWPSGVIREQCFSEDEIGITCNKYCSDTIGAQCNEQIVENIRWTRTPAMHTISVMCPRNALKPEIGNNKTAFGTRPCFRTDENEGVWGKADIDNCISPSLRSLKDKFLKHLLNETIEENLLFVLAHELKNHTASNSYGNPVDVATVIDLLEMLVKTQAEVIVLKVKQWSDGNHSYAKALGRFPTLEETKVFMDISADIINNLLSETHESGWSATQPSGTEGDSLLQVIEIYGNVISRSLQDHVTDGLIGGQIGFEDAYLSATRSKIELSVNAQWIGQFNGYKFPSHMDQQHGIQSKYGSLEVPGSILSATNESELPTFVQIVSFRIKGMNRKLPNHDVKASGKKAKENNLNTPILATFMYAGNVDLSNNLSAPIVYALPYLDTFNISNPECVRLEHGTILSGRITDWNWTREGCELIEDRGKEGVCSCSLLGFYAITTDMYNDNWNKGEVRPVLMNFASYIGCCISATLCLATCILHIYYKTPTTTIALHKNLGVSVVLGQLSFMTGIELYDHSTICQIFAVCLHYFFLANFLWLMNEAFNLYTVITYSSHAHGSNNDSSSMLRYYIIGWIIPAVLVGAFVGSEGKHYYAKDMCWISWDILWLFIGPALGIIAVSVMVLIFTAKEHKENSYTKSEKSNKSIILLMKGLWTQIILITVVWSFAFISLKMSDRILKYIFGLFNSLQGTFFLIFYLLLNEEVRNKFKSKKKKKALTVHGYDDTDERSPDSQSSTHIAKKGRAETLALDPKPYRRRDKARNKRRSKDIPKATNDKEDECMASDCEMITSV